ncbi:helix-turn-helix domain-containing protein [Providencia sp. PROV202]|uniref:helix-turn-helix domain-containing protein n=1 Tax=Providencia sp. PROV202 TaxID=2949902 RepID=UPI00234BD1FD|nr:helix-turn-helix transcriptional regulator [Providencia sp. PROV202]
MMKNKYRLREEVGSFIREARLNCSLTGEELGRMLHISQQQISRYERGITSINIETLDAILNKLGKDWSEFFFKVIANYSDEIAEIKLQDNFLFQDKKSKHSYYDKLKFKALHDL